jgi:hypothetical protein
MPRRRAVLAATIVAAVAVSILVIVQRGERPVGPLLQWSGGLPGRIADCLTLGPTGRERVGQAYGMATANPTFSELDGPLEVSFGDVDASLTGPARYWLELHTEPVPFGQRGGPKIPWNAIPERQGLDAEFGVFNPVALPATVTLDPALQQQVSIMVEFTHEVDEWAQARLDVTGIHYTVDGRHYRFPIRHSVFLSAVQPYTHEDECVGFDEWSSSNQP